VERLEALAAEARSKTEAMASATAADWEARRDEALDALRRLYDRAADATAEIRGR
jgi:hypothetical protein